MSSRCFDDDAQDRRELEDVLAAIADVQAQHEETTGRPALHLGRCRRGDLHEQLAALYARAKALTVATTTTRARSRA